jgi:DNA-binding NtrC family response regulator
MSPDQRIVGLVEDDPIMGESLVQRLALEGIAAKWWRRGAEAIEGVAGERLRAVVCDIRLPDMDGEAVFRATIRKPNAPPFLFITGYGDIDQAVRLMRDGAADYVTKPFEMDDFLARLGELLGPDEISCALGVSPVMQDLEHLLRRIARNNSGVLISGETGAGKEVAARFLHAVSAAADKPFMAVNCAAIPSDLLESELFGHEKGAFTGARQRHLGYAERAGEGVLFLDEIGELRPDLQAKLLRLIEDRAFLRVGGERPIQFRARLMAATNSDLDKLVEAGRFRADLYYRINVVSVRIPPLRDRRDDIPPLMARFFEQFRISADARLRGFSAAAEEAALAHAWPGNVRELRNRMERAVALAPGPWLMPADLFPELVSSITNRNDGLGSLEDARQEAEKRHILRALALTGGEIIPAAKALGIGRTTLWEKMRRLGLRTDAEGRLTQSE